MCTVIFCIAYETSAYCIFSVVLGIVGIELINDLVLGQHIHIMFVRV